jgi:predicted permease
MLNDVRFAARLLAKDWGFTTAAVVALAIGMSATITMFTIVHGVYLRDLPFTDSDQVVTIGTRPGGGPPDQIGGVSRLDLQDLQAFATRFDGIGGAVELPMDLSDDEQVAERSVGGRVSANAFELIGHRPVLGRDFAAADDREGAAPVVILGYRVWQRRYGGDPGILGEAVRVNGVTATVIGVMPDGFGFPVRSELWLPLGAQPMDASDARRVRNIDAFGRMGAGVTRDQATTDLSRILDRLAEQYPESHANLVPVVRPYRDGNTDGPIRTVFTGLMGAVVFLLLIACANVANLLLARGASRAREITVRLALGASRRQVIRQLLAESLLLALVAGLAGTALAAAGVRLFRQSITGSGEPYWLQFPMESGVFAFVAAVCLGTTVLCGLAPALHTSKVGLTEVLSEAGRGTAGARRARRWTDLFVIVQVALSLTLLAGAGLMMRNVVVFSEMEIGADTADLVTAEVALPQAYSAEDDWRAFYRRLNERLTSLPGMRAGIASALPLRRALPQRVSIEGRPPAPAGEAPVVSTVAVGPGYLEALGIRPVRGRLFVDADDSTASRLVVVNERFVQLNFPGGEAVGRSIRLERMNATGAAGELLTIIGVVPNVRQVSPRQDRVDARLPDPVAYVPYASMPGPNAAIVVRSSAGTAAVAAALREVVRPIDPDAPVLGVMPFDEMIAQELQLLLVFGSMFGLFASAALGIAGIGLYAVTAYAVAQRTREMGVRIALGARARHVWWVVTRRAAMQLGVGIALGLAGALGAGELLQGLLTGVGSRDPLTLIGVPVVMIAVSLVACVVPARRAMRLDPVAALRAE